MDLADDRIAGEQRHSGVILDDRRNAPGALPGR
jgi:hypothetical protein